jgi:hypothetical protein
MNRTLRFAGLVLASLTISTVAMAQQGGGGRGGDGGGAGGNSGDSSVLDVLREDQKRARLSRAVQSRRDPVCLTHACGQTPTPMVPPRERIAQFEAVCAGGDVLVLHRADGRKVRYVCRNL